MSWRDGFPDGEARPVSDEELSAFELTDEEKVFAMSAGSYARAHPQGEVVGIGVSARSYVLFAPAIKGQPPLIFRVDDRGGTRGVTSLAEVAQYVDRLIPMLPVSTYPRCSTCNKKFVAGDLTFVVKDEVSGKARAFCPTHIRRVLTRPRTFSHGFFAADELDEADPVVMIRIARNVDAAIHVVDDIVKIYLKKYEPKNLGALMRYVEVNKHVLRFTRDRILSSTR